ncbi:facilitated trehalose transporter Tret1-like isoform X2 [Cryptotermes secundus]|uniref:facilitated trehalose transporter Tret1-like isoform X2 n=1 Tax=Cryptotermes secundus TaxID=105785 RepID=UPI001454DDBD|nr:facilitated trehalose transporter Tret1-like isoform X2 [Cryptotermes secundus]
MSEDSDRAHELDLESTEFVADEDSDPVKNRTELTCKPDLVPQGKPRWKDAIPQVLASCVVHSIVVQAGVSMAYLAVLLPQLADPDSISTATKDQSSWIASLVIIGTLIGSLVTGPLMAQLGCRTTCQLSCVPLVVAWVVVCLAQSVGVLYVGRLLAGVSGVVLLEGDGYLVWSPGCHEFPGPVVPT